MEWKSEYEIGVDSVDTQHRQLVEMISRLETSSSTDTENREMGNALKFLVDYTNQHFSEEEAFMIKFGFPGYDHQKALHKDFIQEVMAVLLKLKRGESISPRELIGFLPTGWWITSWMKIKKLANFIADAEKRIPQ